MLDHATWHCTHAQFGNSVVADIAVDTDSVGSVLWAICTFTM